MSKLLQHRILFIGNEITDETANIIIAQMLHLAAAKPSAISFWRVSIAFNSGGQTNFTVNQINTANAIACAISVKLMFIFDPCQ